MNGKESYGPKGVEGSVGGEKSKLNRRGLTR